MWPDTESEFMNMHSKDPLCKKKQKKKPATGNSDLECCSSNKPQFAALIHQDIIMSFKHC